ncbi:MAG: pyridoxal phosphate-dependent aminotransferase [Chitinophagales bacterium]|jgi:aspartate aminotransferase|nr:pyridoxal phosphate-dependent aminotransferase [Sphingobacteriales bacterium]
MSVLSKRVLRMKESATLAMARKSRELKEGGVDIINLSLGEPDFDTPDNIKEACKIALDKGDTKYTPVSGSKLLREAICRKLKRENNLDYSFDQIVVSNGAKQAIANACMALLDEGDEILVPSPYWLSYAAIGELAQGKVIEVYAGADENFKPSAKKLESFITSKTKVILFSSPCNPTGAVFNRHDLTELVEVLKMHPRIHVISDEIYEHINYIGQYAGIAQFEEIKDRVILVNGFSKAYAMTGWRLGYMAASKEIALACDKIQGQITSGACSFNQTAAIEALDGNQEMVHNMVDKFKQRRELVLNRLSEIPGIVCPKPDGAFYLFPDIRSYFGKSAHGFMIHDSEDMALYLLEKAHVAIVGGKSFGDANCIRMSFAASEEMINKAFDRIKIALSELA